MFEVVEGEKFVLRVDRNDRNRDRGEKGSVRRNARSLKKQNRGAATTTPARSASIRRRFAILEQAQHLEIMEGFADANGKLSVSYTANSAAYSTSWSHLGSASFISSRDTLVGIARM